MNFKKITKLVPVLGIACMVSLPAMAQTTTSGTMTPAASSQAPTTKAAKAAAKKQAKMDKKADAKNKADMDATAKDSKATDTSMKDATAKDAGKTKDKDKDKASALPASEQFSSLSAATAHCASSTVEWATLGGSKVYHSSKSRYFGKTKSGAYACKAALDSAGFRPAKD